jgi:hypothetical protein
VLNRWRKPGDEKSVQRFNQDYTFYDSAGYLMASDGIWADASYIRLTNASLSYQFPESWKHKMHVQQARIFTSAQNVFTIYMHKGAGIQQPSYSSVPVLLTWTFGMQVTL